MKTLRFGCIGCGKPFTAIPPDDRHIIATRNEGDYEDNIMMTYKCNEEDCETENIIYWGTPGFGVSLRRVC